MMNWKELEGSDCGLFQGIIPPFAWKDRGKPQSMQSVSRLKFEPGTYRIRARRVAACHNLLATPILFILIMFFI
jgi:hypothetical protein